MRRAIFLALLMLMSTTISVVVASTTETQFTDGTSSYTHTFTGQGTGSAGSITLPYGAEVTYAEFNLIGESSTTQYSNHTTNAHWGGQGKSNSWSGSAASPFTSGQRNGLEAQNGDLSLASVPTSAMTSIVSSDSLAMVGATRNNTGQFASLGDQGYNGISKKYPDLSVSSQASWNYVGVVIKVEDEFHVFRYSQQQMYASPTILRINSTTGSYIGTASMSTGSCTNTYIHDATMDSSGNVWTAHSTYTGRLSKWTVSETSWVCSSTYTFSGKYMTGVDFDDDSGKLYATYCDNTYPTYYRYLYELNPSSPTSINGTWLLGGDSTSCSSTNNVIAGLKVSNQRVIVNEYSQSGSKHYHYHLNGAFLNEQGIQTMPNGGHYGITETDDGKIAFACHHQSFCTQRKITTYGDGDLFDSRNPTSTSGTITSATRTLTKAVSSLKLAGLIGVTPTGTSIEIDISNDGGQTWKKASVGQTVNFANSGNQLKWKAYLNGTTSVTPILDLVNVEYIASYTTSGYLYVYQYIGSSSSNTVAVQVDYNATMPSGTSIRINHGPGASTTSCGNGNTGVYQYTQSGQSKATPQNTGYYHCLRIELQTSSSANSPILHELSVKMFSNVPEDVSMKVGQTTVYSGNGALLGSQTISSSNSQSPLITAFNNRLDDESSGTLDIPIEFSSSSSGKLTLESFEIQYIMQTVNLDMNVPSDEILHARNEPYEIVTRHVIGEYATQITEATLTLTTNQMANNPIFTWNSGDIFPEPNDPGDYIELDVSSYSIENNGILEIHWIFHVTDNFPDQDAVGFRAHCTDDTGSNGYSPLPLVSNETMRVNRTYGLGTLSVLDSDGELQRTDVPDNGWVAAGEQIHFTGAMWFQDTMDAPLDSAFDVRVARNGYVEATARDTTNTNGSFFISVDVPNLDIPDGITYEVQTYNERDASHVAQPNSDWSRTFRVDNTDPTRVEVYPEEDAYEAADRSQEVRVLVNDEIGIPIELTLNYWVEADHDLNRNGEADPSEYVQKIVRNETLAEDKWFVANIDHSRNPNMGRVSYFWDGGDQAGNPLHWTVMDDEGNEYVVQAEHGFNYDDATFRTRKDSSAIFTGLDWVGHLDDEPVYAGKTQTITLGFIDANTAIDFEHISLVFDFEGPNPLRDAQRISYSGVNDTFWSESPYLILFESSNMVQTTNESGMPWIIVTFEFMFDWDWPDEEIGDVALLYKERGNIHESRILLLEHTFRVENDLVLSPDDYEVNDISEPRTGQVADGTRVRKDDRLQFTGRVVYEGSNVAAPRDVGILVDVFDGEQVYSDGSLGEDGSYSVEVPLSAASTLQSSPTRTCLISITNIPGRGEDMTGTLVSTTLRVVVDDAAPRVTRRIAPLNVIDVSSTSDLSSVPVEFQGTEDADLTGSYQTVHWVMRDATRTITIGAGSSPLGMRQDGQSVIWTGEVDLTAGGTISPREGDFIGFYLTGWDAAGNQFPVVSNSEASPIPELAEDDTDFERQWVRLGAVGPELKINGFTLSDDHVSPGSKITMSASVTNTGGDAEQGFMVAFFAGNSDDPFDTVALTGLESLETIIITSKEWSVEEVDRVRVVVDYGNQIPEANDFDNTAEHDLDVAYGQYMGWLDSPKENPLAWVFTIVGILVLVAVGSIASRTAIDHGEGAFEDDVDWDEEDDEEENDEEDDDY